MAGVRPSSITGIRNAMLAVQTAQLSQEFRQGAEDGYSFLFVAAVCPNYTGGGSGMHDFLMF